MVTKIVAKPKLLITRPEPQAQQLASTLERAGFQSLCQPLFNYQSNQSLTELQTLLAQTETPILIFVSKAAVQFAQQLLPITTWPSQRIIAVGNTTQAALKEVGITGISTPSRQDSDGVLALPELTNVVGKDIIIIRGDGGRELIAEELQKSGANVSYFESYKRHWLTLPETIIDSWQNQAVSAIIITSNALLESVVQLTKNGDNFWQNTCLWLVASERIASNAKALGLRHVVCTNGASDHAILNALEQLEFTHD